MAAAVGPSRVMVGQAPRATLAEQVGWAGDDLRRAPLGLVAGLMAIALLAVVLRHIDPEADWWTWPSMALVLWGWRLCALCSLGHPGMRPAGRLLRWQRRDTILQVLQGIVPGMACAAYQPMATGFEQLTLITVVYVTLLGALPTVALQPRMMVLHAIVTVFPMALAVARDHGDPHHAPLMGILLLLMSAVVWLAGNYRSAVLRLQRLGQQADALRRDVAAKAAQAEQARLRAEAADQAKTYLIAAASHDLRQPLLALDLYVGQVRQRLASPHDDGLVQGMVQSVRALDRMLSDLLDMARCESGALSVCTERVRLSDVFERLLPQLHPAAHAQGLGLRWRGGHHVVMADPLMLERCLRNLVINAVAHTPSGGVLVGARLQGKLVRLQVWDTGRGLSSDEQRRVFDDYYQVVPGGRPLLSRHRGSGLGLGIVRRLSHLMGAQVGLQSRVGRGSVFELRLPAAETNRALPAAPALSRPGTAWWVSVPACSEHC